MDGAVSGSLGEIVVVTRSPGWRCIHNTLEEKSVNKSHHSLTLDNLV